MAVRGEGSPGPQVRPWWPTRVFTQSGAPRAAGRLFCARSSVKVRLLMQGLMPLDDFSLPRDDKTLS